MLKFLTGCASRESYCICREFPLWYPTFLIFIKSNSSLLLDISFVIICQHFLQILKMNVSDWLKFLLSDWLTCGRVMKKMNSSNSISPVPFTSKSSKMWTTSWNESAWYPASWLMHLWSSSAVNVPDFSRLKFSKICRKARIWTLFNFSIWAVNVAF